MRKLPRTSLGWLLVALLAFLSMPSQVCALSYELSVSDSTETLRLSLDADNTIPLVSRTGTTRLVIAMGKDVWKREARPAAQSFPDSRLIRSIAPTDTGLVLTMATNGFGFIKLPTQRGSMTLQIFRDPIGARWKPRSTSPESSRKKPEPAAKPLSQRKVATPSAKSSIKDSAAPVPAKPMSAEKPTQQKSVQKLEKPSSLKDQPGDMRKPFFSVPYAMRAPIQKDGPSRAEAFSTTAEPPKGASSPALTPAMLPELSSGTSAESPPSASVDPPAQSQDAASEVAELQKQVVQKNPDVAPVPAATASADGGLSAQSALPGRPAGPSLRMKAVRKTLEQMLADAEKGVGSLATDAEQSLGDAATDIRQDVVQGGALGRDIAAEAEAGKVGEAVDIIMENATQAAIANASLEGEQVALEMDNATLHRIEIETQLDQATSMLMADNYAQAVDLLGTLLKDPDFPEELREETLYTMASAKFQLHKDELATHFGELTGAFDQAINYNPKSPRVPEGLLNLGLINMKVGNLPEAGAYFNILKKKYPDDDNIPFIEYYWGQYHFDRGEYRKAADRFQYLVQTFPDSKVVREAALGLANSLDQLGFNQQAYQIIDYIDKRWPRYYVDSPEFLRLSGNIANKLDKFEKAKTDYWTFYNLTPEAKDMDIVLARIGDIYLREKKEQAAKDVYAFTAKNYPESQGGLVSSMRLAEEGIYDDPNMEQMFTVFDRPYNVRPVEIYTKIVKNFPKSALAPLAQLKLSMWYMFNNQLEEAMGAVQDFFGMYPKSSLAERALDVGLAAFEKSTAQALAEENYPRIVKTWEQHPFLAEYLEKLTPDSRMAVAMSYWKRDTPDKALAMAKPFLEGPKQGKLSEIAVELALNIYLDRDGWSDILTLGNNTADWELPEALRFEVDYAQALAMVNLGQMDKSRKLWAKLAAEYKSDPVKRAYALYYMARFAGEEGQLQKQYVFAQEGLALFLASGVDNQKVKDLLVMLMDATEFSGRLTDTLQWAVEYNSLIRKDAPDWPSFQYRLAGIYRKLGDNKTWRKVLENLIKEKPGSLAARSAQSDLASKSLEEQARQFSSAGGQ